MAGGNSIAVNIRERENEDDDYKRPAILEESDKGSSSEAESDDQESEDDDDDESSDDGVEDDEATLLTPAVDSQILKTIAAIRTKDARVYDSDQKFFTDDQFEEAQKKLQQKEREAQRKKYTLRDYEDEVNVKYGGIVPEDDYDESTESTTKVKTHQEEQEELKNAFKMAAGDEDEDDDNEDGFLQKRPKTEEEIKAEEEEYRNFLLANISNDKATSEAFKEWTDVKEKSNVNEDDAFLMDFVLNRGWMDTGKSQSKTDGNAEQVDLEADEEYLDEVDRFESKYNFRFEEEGGANIITHPRNIEDSVRRKESKRQRERERKKAKKEAKKKEKLEELARQRNKKLKDIKSRLKEIQEITGTDIVGLENVDLDADFDPEKHDAQMAEMFNDDYYNKEDTEKPTWDDDIEGVDDINYNDDDEDIMMDADYLPGGDKYQSTSENASEQASSSKKVLKKEVDDLLDQYYSLNFEDIIGGDLPTRFKYQKTEPEDYGLSPVEILLADDKELNKYVGLKTMAPYRNEQKKQYEAKMFKRNKKRKLRELQKHLHQKGFNTRHDDRKKRSDNNRDKNDKDTKKRKHDSESPKQDSKHQEKKAKAN